MVVRVLVLLPILLRLLRLSNADGGASPAEVETFGRATTSRSTKSTSIRARTQPHQAAHRRGGRECGLMESMVRCGRFASSVFSRAPKTETADPKKQQAAEVRVIGMRLTWMTFEVPSEKYA